VSSPGPPSSEASEQKHSGEEEEEEDADEEDDRGSDNLSYMDRVVMEVVESETVYVRDLQQVVEVTSALLIYFSHPFLSLQPRQRTKETFLFLLLFFTPCTTTIVIIVIIIIIMRKGGWAGWVLGGYWVGGLDDTAIRPEVRNVTLHGAHMSARI
jgi:hypothetical protein